MTGCQMTENDVTTETEVARGMTGAEVARGMTEAEVARGMTEVTTVVKMKTTPEMTGIVENVATLIFHLEQNAIVAAHQRDAAAEAPPNSGLVMTEDLAIEMMTHNLVQEIGNVANARK